MAKNKYIKKKYILKKVKSVKVIMKFYFFGETKISKHKNRKTDIKKRRKFRSK